MTHLTTIEGVPDSSTAVPGMAYFADTGPATKTCGDCELRGYHRQRGNGKTYHTAGCAMFKKLSGRHGPPVGRDNKACKYFEPKALP